MNILKSLLFKIGKHCQRHVTNYPVIRFLPIMFCFVIILCFAFSPISSLLAQEHGANNTPFSYSDLMRSFHIIQTGKDYNSQIALPSEIDGIKASLRSNLEKFIAQEKTRLNKLDVPIEKREQYFNLLNSQLQSLDDADYGKRASKSTVREVLPINEVKIPDHPGGFYFNNEIIQVTDFSSLKTMRKSVLSITEIASRLVLEDDYFPTLADVREDGAEVVINSEIQELAELLNHNPVKIFNFVRNNISYEPYYGAKKGSIGCLHERVGNDVDISSLTIALLRAAGIPARYKKSIIVMPVDQLQNLLGVDDTKTVYAALFWNKVPVFTLSGSDIGEDFEAADFSGITELALEWVFVEAFYEYDERGANIDNMQSFEAAATTEDVLALLRPYSKKQWIPIDSVIKPYFHDKKEIVHDTAEFDTEQFWSGYLQYQGSISPMDKYIADLQATTGKNINDESYQSTNKVIIKDYSILPYTLPYMLGSGETGDTTIEPETWSTLPDNRRYQIRVSLLKESDNSIVLEHIFYGNEINNIGIDLLYEGATDTDKDIIESYGGIHATPASLVDINPYFEAKFAKYMTDTSLKIGDSCILRFEYSINGEIFYTDEKFSTAGNHEGIYVALSRIHEDSFFDDDNDPDINSKILLKGNVELARQYIRRMQHRMDILKNSLDVSSNINFFRAVVTQNRILNKVNDIPTTFDFKGLTIDATSYITDYSNRGDFETHRKDFHLLWGLEASYYEAQLFTDIAGLEAISTVKGLQYAYSQPSEYTVYTITSSNESLVDSLNLSANTKQNMHTDIQEGCTIITPDKFVRTGTWNGLFYISLKSDGTGTYAIGEQTQQNGGWTTDYFFGENGEYKVATDVNYFIYIDSIGNVKYNSISQETYSDIVNDEDWDKWKYGSPIKKETKTFGDFTHTYIHAANGSKFIGEGYDDQGNSYQLYNYWITKSDVKNILLEDKDKDHIKNLGDIKLDGTFQFNPIAGTYSWFGHYTGVRENYNSFITAYYQPASDGRGHGRMVYGYMLSKLEDKHYNYSSYSGKFTWILNVLGYPTENREYAADSFGGTKGQYQSFIGGHIYIKKGFWSDDTFYVPGEIHEYYNSDDNSIDGERGTGGKFGFPIDDPELVAGNNELLQKFEWKMIQYFVDRKEYETVGHSDYERRMNNKRYCKHVLNNVVEGAITDVEALARLADYVAYVTDTNEMFVKDITMLLYGAEKIVSIAGWDEAYNNDDMNEFQWGNEKATVVDGNKQCFSDTGFKFEYNDSHYLLDGISNQLLHAAAGFNVGYFDDLGRLPRTWFVNNFHEKWEAAWKDRGFANILCPPPLGKVGEGETGYSKEDFDLTEAMAQIGRDLRYNPIIDTDDVGRLVREKIGEPNSKGIPQKELIKKAEKRIEFREYEETKFVKFSCILWECCNPWEYIKDMQWCDCSESWSLCSQYTTVYYQEYEQFDNHEKSLAILNEISPESECRGVHIVYGGILIEFENNDGICGIGVPSNEESDAGEGPFKVQGGRYQHFEKLDGQKNGIYWYPPAGKAYAVTGLISDKYESLGGTWSYLGFPITDFDSTPQKQYFQGGYIEIVNGAACDYRR
jgi:Transglutaminase-like superfamily/LGFP repeat